MADLDTTAQKLLNKDPHNPNSPKKIEVVRPGLGLSKSTLGPSKPSLREAMMAQRKAAMATKNLPARPGSAMSHFSPVKTTSNTTKSSTTRSRPEPVTSNTGGMSGAPMRPTRRRPEMAARPATAGPYSVRDLPGVEAESPESVRTKTATPKPKETTPRRVAQRQRPGHVPQTSESSLPSPGARSTRSVASPRVSPAKLKQSQPANLPSSSPSRANEDFTLVVPNLASLTLASPPKETQSPSPALPAQVLLPESTPGTPSTSLKVYEDPFTDEQATPKPTFTVPVLEDKPVNEDAANLAIPNGQGLVVNDLENPEKAQQNQRLLASGISRVKAKTLDVHGFRKLQSLLRDSKGIFTDDKFEALLIGLFQYLEDPLPSVAPEKAQDVKAQILATIKLLLKKERDNFQPHVSKGLESLLETRAAYDTRAHIVSGLELLADELVTIGDGSEIVMVLTKRLESCDDAAAEDSRILSTGLHVLRALLDKRTTFIPTDSELNHLANLARRCLDSSDSGVRHDAVQLCVALHARIGEAPFWDALKDVKTDPKNLITYYIARRQRELGSA